MIIDDERHTIIGIFWTARHREETSSEITCRKAKNFRIPDIWRDQLLRGSISNRIVSNAPFYRNIAVFIIFWRDAIVNTYVPL